MRQVVDRTVLTVVRAEGAWAVETGGDFFGHSVDKEVAKAFALKRAREIVDRGGGVEVRINGDGQRR